MMSLMWSVTLLLLLAVSRVRLQCTSGAALLSQCQTHGLRQRNFLLYDRGSTESVDCSFNRGPETTYTWTRSPDGSEANQMSLDTSSDQYVFNERSLSITFDNVSGADGGLYRCAYNGSGVTRELCVAVYERAVFASCPSEYDGCTEVTQLLVTAGQSANFDATVMYTPGGSCDFQQELTRVNLWKINDEFVVPDELLFSCSTAEGAVCTINNPRVSWSRGRDPGLEFKFTLTNTSTVQTNDSSLYKVIVMKSDPKTGTTTELKKRFYLQVLPALSVPPPIPPTTTDPTTFVSNPAREVSSGDDGAVAAAVVVPLLVVILLVLIVVGLLFLIMKWKQGSWPPSVYHYKHKPPVVQTLNATNAAVKTPQTGLETDSAGPGTAAAGSSDTFRVIAHCTEVQPLDSTPNSILIRIDESVVVSLPPENTRMSFIDDVHELPCKLTLPDKPAIPEKTLESPGVPV